MFRGNCSRARLKHSGMAPSPIPWKNLDAAMRPKVGAKEVVVATTRYAESV